MMLKTALLTVIAFAGSINAALTSTQVVNELLSLTKQSRDANTLASSIGYNTLFDSAPKTLNGFRDIVSSGTRDNIILPGTLPFTEERDVGLICSAWRAFAKEHQYLINTMVAKFDVLSKTPFVAPFAAVIRADEAMIDSLAYTIIGLAPGCDSATSAQQNVKKALADAVAMYSHPTAPFVPL